MEFKNMTSRPLHKPDLAIKSYFGAVPTDTDRRIDLSWTSDERDAIDVDLLSVVKAQMQGEMIDRYMVDDPYGHLTLESSIRRYFSIERTDLAVTTGAGVGAMLFASSLLFERPQFHAVGVVYPDVIHWLCLRGGKVASIENADLVVVERPAVMGTQQSKADISDLLVRTRHRQGIVVIDESNANYESPSFSAISLFESAPEDSKRLIVLRGLSKAYGLGSLRFGCAISNTSVLQRLRSTLPPLQVAAPVLAVARAIYDMGDVCAGLRASISERKPRLVKKLLDLGFTSAFPSVGHLPYVLTESSETRAFTSNGSVIGKIHNGWSQHGAQLTRGRFSVPLSDRRWSTLQAARLV